MNFKEKIILISGVILFISLIASLIFREISYILFAFIMCIFLFYIYLYNIEIKNKNRENLDINHRDFINNKICIKPTKENPFMNPTIIDLTNKDLKACDIDNTKIKKEIDNYFKNPVYKDVIDIYDRKFSERQFYTMPASSIPNDREKYLDWLYYRDKTCKENNGERCYYNII